MITLRRCKDVNHESIVVVKCNRCKGLNIGVSIDYTKNKQNKSYIKRLQCRQCDHIWDVEEDLHMEYEEVSHGKKNE